MMSVLNKKPEITDGKLCALFHTAKVGVGASHSPVVAKDPGHSGEGEAPRKKTGKRR